MNSGSLRGIGKGNAEFDLPIHERFAEALRDLTPDGPWVLPGRWPRTHVSPNTVWMWVRLAGERAQLGRVTPHQLRHTAIATVHDATGDLRTAAEFGRHVDIKTTMIYTRTKRKKLVEGMAAL